MNKVKTVDYLNEHYSINGSFYWIAVNSNKLKMIPASQKNIPHLYDFGIGTLCTEHRFDARTHSFYFYIRDLQNSYGFKVPNDAQDIYYNCAAIDEVMQQVSAFIIVNGMCDLQHKDLSHGQKQHG